MGENILPIRHRKSRKNSLVYIHLQSLLVQFTKIMNLTKSPLHFNGQKGLLQPPSGENAV